MVDYLLPFIIITLIVVIIIQALERVKFADHQQKEQSRLIAAIIAKNPLDYTQALQAEKKEETGLAPESDEVELTNADDSVFDKFVKAQNQ